MKRRTSLVWAVSFLMAIGSAALGLSACGGGGGGGSSGDGMSITSGGGDGGDGEDGGDGGDGGDGEDGGDGGDGEDGGDGMSIAADDKPVAVFNIIDSCVDRSIVQYRFFQYRTWHDAMTVSGQSPANTWPGGDEVYLTNPGETHRHRLSCTAGYGVCFGANQRSRNTHIWGAGIDGSENCQAGNECCVRCPSSGTATFAQGRLTC